MAHKEPRTKCCVYLRPEEMEHLKTVAQQKEVSLSDLIGTTVLKKYPMPKKKKARSENLASQIANDIPSELPEQVPLDEPSPKQKESQVDDVVSCDVESMTQDEQKARLKFVKHKLHMAYNGEYLDKETFNAYMQERDKLQAILGHK